MIDQQMIAKAIKDKGITAIAAKAEISVSTLFMVKAGRYPSNLKPSTKSRLAAAVGVRVSELFPTATNREQPAS